MNKDFQKTNTKTQQAHIVSQESGSGGYVYWNFWTLVLTHWALKV